MVCHLCMLTLPIIPSGNKILPVVLLVSSNSSRPLFQSSLAGQRGHGFGWWFYFT